MNTAELTDLLLDRARMRQLIACGVRTSVEEHARVDEDPGFSRFAHDMLLRGYEGAVDVIHNCAESPIEKIFLGSVVVSFLKNDPFGLVVTPPFQDAAATINSRRGAFRAINEVEKRAASQGGLSRVEEYISWLHDTGQLTPEEAAYWRDLNIIHSFVEDSFHLTPQALFPNLSLDGKKIRVDAIIWVPRRPDLNLVLECDGYSWHSDQQSFARDRRRDRLLGREGYTVLRFAGTEITRDPVGVGIELYDKLHALDGPQGLS